MDDAVNTDIDIVRAQWARLGAAVGGELAPASPDVERLIVNTVGIAATAPGIVIAAVTWLSRFGNLVAEHRLAAMVQRSTIDRARLGLMLDLAIDGARQHDRRRNLSRTLKLCTPAPEPEPFFTISARSKAMVERAERRASPRSRAWNVWMDPIEPKFDAQRTAAWIVEHNPEFRMRADLRGDLRASLLLGLSHDGKPATINQLVEMTGATRLAVAHALDELELSGRVRCERIGRTRVYHLAAIGSFAA